MRNVFLVARREFKQIASTRGFWVMLLVLPVVIAITQVAGRFLRPEQTSAYVLVDESGAFVNAIDHRIELNRQRTELGDLSAYVERWGVGSARPEAIWAKGKRWFTDVEVERFMAEGGAQQAVRVFAPALPRDAPRYDVSRPSLVRAEIPIGVPTDEGPGRLGEALAPYLQNVIRTREGDRPLALAAFIPASVTTDNPIRIWTNGTPNSYLIDVIRTEITRILRARALEKAGLSSEAARLISTTDAPVALSAPRQGEGRERIIIRSTLPLAMVYLLLVTVMVTGSMMLQGVIEERSNKLLESILACLRPAELMYGKLLGLGAIGLTILGVWVGAAVGASVFMQGFVADIVRPSLAAIDEPWMVLAMMYYFLAGYLIISMLYLAIGALSNSLQDAQSYLMPVVLLITLPTVFMMVSVVSSPNSPFPQIMSWIPLYTPFSMMARLGTGVTIAEVLTTGVMLAVFVVAELYLLGRVFRASLLRTGQPPTLSGLIGMMLERKTG